MTKTDKFDVVIIGGGSAVLMAVGELTGMAGGSLVGERYFSGSLSAVFLSGLVAAEGVLWSQRNSSR